MQVAKSEVLRLIDYDGIGVRYIYTALYDSSGKQHIVIVIGKVDDYLFQLIGLHLSVPYAYTAIGDITQNHRFQLRQILNPVVHEEHLSVTAHLEIDGIGDNLLIKSMHLGLYRIAVGRRSLNDRKVARTNQRELQCTRYRRSGHGKRIHVHLKLTELFFHTNTELLFLIDNEQAQVFKLHALAYHLMSTYYYINVAISQFLQYAAGLLCSTGTCKIIYLARHTF